MKNGALIGAGAPFLRSHAIQSLFVCLFLVLISINLSCGEPNVADPGNEEEKDIQILNPKAGEDYFYTYFEPIDIIYKYNPQTIKTPALIYYSKDEKKTWNLIIPDSYKYNKLNRNEDDPFEYATFKWTPEKESLTKINIHLKAVGYDPDPFDDVDIIGPVEID